ncbi:MAG: YqeG family HAD IIIA-type phosphatase [Patescibacteria group bacterium]
MKKGFIRNLLPDHRFEKIIDIMSDFFSGSQLVIFDLDNTLVFSEKTESTKEIINWIASIKNRYKCVCISNSRTAKDRAQKISKALDIDIFLSKEKKPSKKLFEEIKKKYNLGNGKIFVVGDRVFTDILFGNLNGAATVLIKPLSRKENILIKIIRKIENAILFLVNLIYT